MINSYLDCESFEDKVRFFTNNLSNLLVSKNKKYGNSALEPKRVFSKASAIEQLLVRLDDKLSRLANQTDNDIDDEDVIEDLLGYLILLKIAKADISSLK